MMRNTFPPLASNELLGPANDYSDSKTSRTFESGVSFENE